MPVPMSSSSSNSEREAEFSLYDPPPGGGEDVELKEADHEVLHLDIPRELAQQLLDVATHLGLTPSIVASRAIDFVCNEIGTVEGEALSTGTFIQQYQAQLDLLHALEEAASGQEDEDPSWEAVNEIIQAAERKKNTEGETG